MYMSFMLWTEWKYVKTLEYASNSNHHQHQRHQLSLVTTDATISTSNTNIYFSYPYLGRIYQKDLEVYHVGSTDKITLSSDFSNSQLLPSMFCLSYHANIAVISYIDSKSLDFFRLSPHGVNETSSYHISNQNERYRYLISIDIEIE